MISLSLSLSVIPHVDPGAVERQVDHMVSDKRPLRVLIVNNWFTDRGARSRTRPQPDHRTRRHGRVLCQRGASPRPLSGGKTVWRTCFKSYPTLSISTRPSRSGAAYFPLLLMKRESMAFVQGWQVRAILLIRTDFPHNIM